MIGLPKIRRRRVPLTGHDQSKDANLFDESAAYSKILGVDPSQVRKKIRSNADTADRDSLLTSTDLFGDIIDDFRSVESEPVSLDEPPPEPITPSERKAQAEDKNEIGVLEAAAELLGAGYRSLSRVAAPERGPIFAPRRRLFHAAQRREAAERCRAARHDRLPRFGARRKLRLR